MPSDGGSAIDGNPIDLGSGEACVLSEVVEGRDSHHAWLIDGSIDFDRRPRIGPDQRTIHQEAMFRGVYARYHSRVIGPRHRGVERGHTASAGSFAHQAAKRGD